MKFTIVKVLQRTYSPDIISFYFFKFQDRKLISRPEFRYSYDIKTEFLKLFWSK